MTSHLSKVIDGGICTNGATTIKKQHQRVSEFKLMPHPNLLIIKYLFED